MLLVEEAELNSGRFFTYQSKVFYYLFHVGIATFQSPDCCLCNIRGRTAAIDRIKVGMAHWDLGIVLGRSKEDDPS